MQEEILLLEKELDSLLPRERLIATSPSEALLETAAKWSDSVWKMAKELGELSFTKNQMEQALQFCERPVFICGVHRGGTTLLRDMLDDHPSLSVLPSEGTFITNQEQQILALPLDMRCSFLCKLWLRRLVNSINQPPYWLLGRSSTQSSPYVYFTRAFITWWNFFANEKENKNDLWPMIVVQLAYAFAQNKFAENSTVCCWVDKTPTNERYLARLWRQFPEAKILHIIRDPKDVFASRKKSEPFTPPRVFIRDLRMSFKVAYEQQTKNDSRYLLIKYEDLCSDPSAMGHNVSAFLGIQYLPCLINPTVAGKPTQANSSFKPNTVHGKILSADEHRHEKLITSKEMQLLSAALHQNAFKLGYTLPAVNALKAFMLRIINRI